jgi:16S rRNA (cytidine1402-2'-O)-methyltransferase
VDAIACEDTRHTGMLLQHLGIHRPLLALHAHNENAAADAVLARLARGERVACVSDAGTPAISDPGARLVARAHAAGYRVLPIPGPSAVAAAVSVAGLAARHWLFVGFLPAHGRERLTTLRALLAQPAAVVLYESPQRLENLLHALADAEPQRRVTLGRELTKQFETVHRAAAADLPAWWASSGQRARGEFVVVVDGPATLGAEWAGAAGPGIAPGAGAAASLEAERVSVSTASLLATLQRELPLRQAVDLAVEITGLPRKRLYAEALARSRAAQVADGAAEGAADAVAEGADDAPDGAPAHPEPPPQPG